MAEKIPIASDHAGYEMKRKIVEYLGELGYEAEDLGPGSERSSDYPDFAGKVASLVSSGERQRGILVCGTGIGMSIAANKFPGVRAANVHNEELAGLSRTHNNANVLALGGRVLDDDTARRVVRKWLETGFSGGRHAQRVEKIGRLESGCCR